jgi:hypothetical protein
MTAREPNEAFDVATVTADDHLLDALGRGEAAPADDEVAAMLAAWRADLATDIPTVRRPAPGVIALEPERRRRAWRPSRALLAAAAVVIAFAGGVTIAAGGAGPDSPLWPITRLIYTDRAESRQAQQDAEQAISRAREAINQGRYTDAEKQLVEAKALVGQVHDPQVAQRLLEEIAAVTGLLPGGLLNQPSHPAGAPSPNSGGRSPGGQNGNGGSGGEPQPTQSGGGLPLPPLPSLPLPTISISVGLPPVLGG